MQKIVDKKECCGCSACANICPVQCIHMEYDEEGFLYPQIDQDSCMNCGLCQKTCPLCSTEKEFSNAKQRAALVQHKNSEVLQQSTSGGAFSAIAAWVIENGGVVFGVEMDSEFHVKQAKAEKTEELEKFRNSKYVQSDPGFVYREVRAYLEAGRLVCFSGTPCQAEGLRRFLNREYKNLILVDVVCRAVPSPGVWREYIRWLEGTKGKIKSIRFRDKKLGYQYSTMEVIYENGKVQRRGIESSSWLRMFFSGMIIRPSCAECRFRKQYRNVDFTIWDCFHVADISKSFDETKGVTQMLIHTDRGLKIFQEIKKDFIFEEIPVDMAVNGMRELRISPPIHKDRDKFYAELENAGMGSAIVKFFPDTFAVRCRHIGRRMLNYTGMDLYVKRLLRKMKNG